MKPSTWISFAVALWVLSNVAVAQDAKEEKKNVPQVPQEETYPGRVTGETPSADPGGVRGTAPPSPGPGEPKDSVTVTPPAHRTPGAPPGTVTAVEPRGSFGAADKNRSGFIEQEEATEVQGLDFITADADRDGRLSFSEFEVASRKGAREGGESSSGASGGGSTR